MSSNANQTYLPNKNPLAGRGSKAGRFVLTFLELQIPMVLGAVVCYLVSHLASASPSYAAIYHPGTYVYGTADILFLTAPVLVWLIFRRHGRRYSREMMIAMIAPVAMIVVLGELSGFSYLPWLLNGSYPLMCLGMLVYMLYQREHFIGKVGHTA